LVEKRAVIQAVSRARLPGSDRGAIALGLVQDVVVDQDRVRVILFDQAAGNAVPKSWADAVEAAVRSVPGVVAAAVEVRPAAAPAPAAGRGRPVVRVPGAHIVAVASGKGGVGKSTVTANLAAALAAAGRRVGAVDADIYGFSLPSLLGATAEPDVRDGRIAPVPAQGAGVISMDFFVRGNQPVVWRGPMLGKALQQFLTDVEWGQVEFLLLDLPPGTGDIALDVHEMLPGASEILVTTPDPLAARVAVRAGQMAQKTGHTVLGVVENMSYLPCQHGGTPHRPFGQGGGEAVAQELDVPLLARIPLGSPVRPGSGVFEPDSEAGRIFGDLARRMAEVLGAPPD
jgi:ATP-binding protein involved in chromosome partitioning